MNVIGSFPDIRSLAILFIAAVACGVIVLKVASSYHSARVHQPRLHRSSMFGWIGTGLSILAVLLVLGFVRTHWSRSEVRMARNALRVTTMDALPRRMQWKWKLEPYVMADPLSAHTHVDSARTRVSQRIQVEKREIAAPEEAVAEADDPTALLNDLLTADSAADPSTAAALEDPVGEGDSGAKSGPDFEPRPDWIESQPAQVEGHQTLVLVSDPFDDRFACNEDLERRTREALIQIARERCRQRGLPTDLKMNVTYDDINSVSRSRYYEIRPTSFGDMVQAYQLTVLNTSFQSRLDERIRAAVVERRLAATGLFSGGVLMVVSLLFGVFRFAARKSPDPLRA